MDIGFSAVARVMIASARTSAASLSSASARPLLCGVPPGLNRMKDRASSRLRRCDDPADLAYWQRTDFVAKPCSDTAIAKIATVAA